jgi:serralysin
VSYTLTAGAEVEFLGTNLDAGTAAINLVGNEFANTIVGNAGVNALYGRAGDDVLYGLGGDDILVGEDGNDTLYGGDGNDQLYGGSGADQLSGGAGNDLYFVTDAANVITEGSGQGNDAVYTSVSYTLTAGAEVEFLGTNLDAGTAAINLVGNEFANTIVGNAGANILDGGGGNDTLIGLGGADTFAFTTALGAGNVDTIVGFAGVGTDGDDRIALSHSIFAGLSLGVLHPNDFILGTAAQDVTDRIIYDSNTGAVYFDADGTGPAAAIQFAQLAPMTALTSVDFIVI